MLPPGAQFEWKDHSVDIVAYALKSANDCPSRDPTGWTVSGRCAHNGQWVTLHHTSNVVFHGRYKWKGYVVRLPGASKLDALRFEFRFNNNDG